MTGRGRYRRRAGVPPHRKNNRIGEEPLNAESVVEIIKDFAGRAGFPPEDFAGHSLRSGFLTSAAEAGASALRMAEVSRHRSLDMLLTYVRRADAFRDHAGSGFLWNKVASDRLKRPGMTPFSLLPTHFDATLCSGSRVSQILCLGLGRERTAPPASRFGSCATAS